MPGAMGGRDLIVFLLTPTAPGHDLATCSFCWPVCFLIDFVLIVFILNRRRLFFSYVFFLQRPSLYLFSAPERRMSDGAFIPD
jgi:hypothetical protein